MAEQFSDDFWSIAFLTKNDTLVEGEDDIYENSIHTSSSKSFTFLPPESSDSYPLTMKIQMNNNGGVLDDVSGIPWDASLLLAGFLYGTHEGRRLCTKACSCDDIKLREVNATNGGILELGSGLGIVGLAAVATVVACSEGTTCNSRVVFTDMKDDSILSHLKRNVDANTAHFEYLCESNVKSCNISVEGCDWMNVSHRLQTIMNRQTNDNLESDVYNDLKGPFNLILGSALVYLPEHAAACADTLYYYLSKSIDGTKQHMVESIQGGERRAILVQLPDRSGFTTHFLPRCKELGLDVLCTEFDESLINRIEAGLKKTIASASDYRMYFISKKED